MNNEKPAPVYSFVIDGNTIVVWDQKRLNPEGELTYTWTKNGKDETQEEFGSLEGALFNVLAHHSEEWSVHETETMLVTTGGSVSKYQYPINYVAHCDGCEREDCQACCEHEEHDHYVCLGCGAELDPGVDIDRAMDYND